MEQEIREIQVADNFEDRREWLNSELETLDKVWEEGSKLKTGLSDLLKIPDWQKQYKA